MSDVILTLGGIVFEDLEVPDKIPFGGKQAFKSHKLVGGQRVVDAMGRDDDELKWAGRFFGASALDRALALDALRRAGAPVDLTWDELSYTVLITSFVVDYEYTSNLPYNISCEIITDNAFPTTQDNSDSLDDMVSSDTSSSSSISDLISAFF